jgi:hypothetical protein
MSARALAAARAAMERLVRDVPDFPEPGIVFRDITPLLADHDAFTTTIEALATAGRDAQGAPAELVWKTPTADLETLDPGKADEDALPKELKDVEVATTATTDADESTDDQPQTEGADATPPQIRARCDGRFWEVGPRPVGVHGVNRFLGVEVNDAWHRDIGEVKTDVDHHCKREQPRHDAGTVL